MKAFPGAFLFLVSLILIQTGGVGMAGSAADEPTVAQGASDGTSPSCECFRAGWQGFSSGLPLMNPRRQACATQGQTFAAAFDVGWKVAQMDGAPAQPGACPVACDCYGYGWRAAAAPHTLGIVDSAVAKGRNDMKILTLACHGLGFDAVFQQGQTAGAAQLRATADPAGQVDLMAFLATPPGPCPAAFGPAPAGASALAGLAVGGGARSPGGAPPVSVYTGPSVNAGRLGRRDPAVDAWVQQVQAGNAATAQRRTISIGEAVSIARLVHDGLGFDLGWASTRDERIEFWEAAVAVIHHGHPVYNPLGGDPGWCIKNAGDGRPTTDDVIVRCDSREAWDCIGGAGAEGYDFAASPIGLLPYGQEVFAPSIRSLP